MAKDLNVYKRKWHRLHGEIKGIKDAERAK